MIKQFIKVSQFLAVCFLCQTLVEGADPFKRLRDMELKDAEKKSPDLFTVKYLQGLLQGTTVQKPDVLVKLQPSQMDVVFDHEIQSPKKVKAINLAIATGKEEEIKKAILLRVSKNTI